MWTSKGQKNRSRAGLDTVTPFPFLPSPVPPASFSEMLPEKTKSSNSLQRSSGKLIRRLFVGAMVTPKSKTELKIIERGVLGVGSRGVIRFVESLDQESFHTSDHTTGASSSDASALGSLALRERRSVLAILDKQGWELSQCSVMVMPYGQFLCPGLIDTHTHACQVPNVGVGQQYELLDWLSNITFPRERMFADVNYARKTYNSVVSPEDLALIGSECKRGEE